MTDLLTISEWIAKLGGGGVLALAVVAMIKGWIMLPRERDLYLHRIAQLEARNEKLEDLALRSTAVSMAATTVAATTTAKQSIEGGIPRVQT